MYIYIIYIYIQYTIYNIDISRQLNKVSGHPIISENAEDWILRELQSSHPETYWLVEKGSLYWITIWLFNIAMENHHFNR